LNVVFFFFPICFAIYIYSIRSSFKVQNLFIYSVDFIKKISFQVQNLQIIRRKPCKKYFTQSSPIAVHLISRILKCFTSRIISNIGQPNSKGYSHNEESDSHFWDQMPCSCYQNTVEEFKLRLMDDSGHPCQIMNKCTHAGVNVQRWLIWWTFLNLPSREVYMHLFLFLQSFNTFGKVCMHGSSFNIFFLKKKKEKQHYN
jgi:hypothetical protein